MNKAENGIFELAKKLWIEGGSFRIKHDIADSPEIILETKHYLEVKTTHDEKLSLSRFNNIRFETDKAEVMFEVLMYNIKVEDKQFDYEERKDY